MEAMEAPAMEAMEAAPAAVTNSTGTEDTDSAALAGPVLSLLPLYLGLDSTVKFTRGVVQAWLGMTLILKRLHLQTCVFVEL